VVVVEVVVEVEVGVEVVAEVSQKSNVAVTAAHAPEQAKDTGDKGNATQQFRTRHPTKPPKQQFS